MGAGRALFAEVTGNVAGELAAQSVSVAFGQSSGVDWRSVAVSAAIGAAPSAWRVAAGVGSGWRLPQAFAVDHEALGRQGLGRIFEEPIRSESQLRSAKRGTYRDGTGRLRNSDGTFAFDGGATARSNKIAHGNVAGDQPATLYERYDSDGNFLKHGISQDPGRRYTQAELDGGYLIETRTGPRREILRLERELVETNPGPLNREPWAGRRKK
jgi:hypothetical protein